MWPWLPITNHQYHVTKQIPVRKLYQVRRHISLTSTLQPIYQDDSATQSIRLELCRFSSTNNTPFAPIKKLFECCSANCACIDSCNSNSTNLLSTVSNITVNVYYSIYKVRVITSSFKFGSSEIFISLCTKSAVLFACNKHIKCVKLSVIHIIHIHIIVNGYTTDGTILWFVLSFSPYLLQSFYN